MHPRIEPLWTGLWTPLIRIALGTWLLVAIYAVLHDQYIVRIAPEHFTLGHPPVPGVEAPALQAAVLALGASIAPGLAFGLVLALVSTEGPWPPLPVPDALRAVGWALLLTEGASLGVGLLAWGTGWRVYGAGWYPDWVGPAVIVTQSIQLTAYGVGAGTAAAAIGWAIAWRLRRR